MKDIRENLLPIGFSKIDSDSAKKMINHVELEMDERLK